MLRVVRRAIDKLARKTLRPGAYTEPVGHFRVACTKGTYVRSLAHDLGQKLGCGAHLASLRRLVAGRFDVADALPFDQLLSLSSSELEKRVIPFLKLTATT